MPATSLASQFPSLTPYLASSRLLALYFASSWCPDCVPVTPLVSTVYQNQAKPDNIALKKELNILYVSSDDSSTQMEQYFHKENIMFQAIPFDNVEERTSLKQYFGACAGREAGLLSMTGGKRKYGIPTLIVLDCATEQIVTVNGVDDLERKGLNSPEAWRL